MSECLHILIQYCNDPRPARAAEYDECVRRNLTNPYVKRVHNLVEPHVVVPEEFKRHPKYVEHGLPRWMTYADAFAYANERLVGEVVCLCNLDIVLDPTSNWDEAAEMVRKNVVLCLARRELAEDGSVFSDPGLARVAFANSQDAWVFAAPFDVPDSDFEIGTMGCDNAIAHRIKQTARMPINAGSQYRLLHYDRARGKLSKNQFAVHAADPAPRPTPHAEDRGHYLLPDIDQLKSVDEVLNALNANDVQWYSVICDVLSRFFVIRNPRK
jgi:hypothetical protein